MKFVFLIFFSAFLFACNNENSNSEEVANNNDNSIGVADNKQLVLDKMVGTWQSEDGKSFERWLKNADGTFQSAAYSVKGTDTSWNEQAKIYMEADKWVFENTVKGDNNNKSVKFTSTSFTENSVQFSNPAHDFPTDVNYKVVDANTINAFIVGPNNKGGKDTIPFNYTRVK